MLGYRQAPTGYASAPAPGEPCLPSFLGLGESVSLPILPQSWPGDSGPMTQPAGAKMQLQSTQTGG
jgi:hypothetical protein